MICDNCGKKNAIVSYVKMQDSEIEEVHLCAECAEEKMMKDITFNTALSGTVENFLKDLFKLRGKLNKTTIEKKCSHCGTTFEEISENKIGCENCYTEFKDEIESMLVSLTSLSKHKGKIPTSASGDLILKREENELIDKLSVAIELEEYEEAANLRDRLKELRSSK